jgi:single-stranded DNA-binding protein
MGKVIRVKHISDSVTKFTLVTIVGSDKSNQNKQVFVPVTALGLSEEQKRSIRQGNLIALEGIVAQRRYQKNGSFAYETSVQVSRSGIKLA